MQEKLFTVLLLISCVFSGVLNAEPSLAPAALLDQSMSLISDATAPLRIDFDFEGVTKDGEEERTIQQHYSLLFKNKEMLQMSFLEKGTPFLQLYSTGSQWTVYYSVEQFYATRDGATTRESFLSMLFKTPFEEGGNWLTAFFTHNPSLLDAVTESKYSTYNSSAHRLLLSSDTYDATLLLSAGEKPWLQSLEMDLSKNFANNENAPTIKFRILNLTIREDNTISDKAFTFTPGEDDYELPSAPGSALKAGDKAPPVSLPQLDGDWAKLSEHRGKNIIVLDFFATWCGPCRMAMPLVDKVRKNLEGKGVVFYAVNQQESEDKVRKLMQDLNLEIPVLMDQKGLVSNAYGVSSIPHMVIIGTDGIIKTVHVGAGPDLDETLTQELKHLLTQR